MVLGVVTSKAGRFARWLKQQVCAGSQARLGRGRGATVPRKARVEDHIKDPKTRRLVEEILASRQEMFELLAKH